MVAKGEIKDPEPVRGVPGIMSTRWKGIPRNAMAMHTIKRMFWLSSLIEISSVGISVVGGILWQLT